jgi:hypothetical protein
MTVHNRLRFSAAVMVLCSTAAAAAEPITATYHVEVTERMTPQSNPIWLPFESQQFTLSMTFDPALVRPLGTGWTYGPVMFSSVPLLAVAPPAGLPLTTEAQTAHGRFEADALEMTDLFASASQSESHIGSDWHYFRHTRLFTHVHIGDAPVPFTAETFLPHLVLGSPFNFGYGTTLFQMTPSLRLVDAVDYRGFARLIDVAAADPVPDPATVTLVGGGGALMLLRRRNRRNSIH